MPEKRLRHLPAVRVGETLELAAMRVAARQDRSLSSVVRLALQEYVLIDTDTRTTDVYRKGADGLWVLHPFAGDQAVELASVALTIPAAVLFDELDAPTVAESAVPVEAR